MLKLIALILIATPTIAAEAEPVELPIGNIAVSGVYVTVTFGVARDMANVKCAVYTAENIPLAAQEETDISPPAHSMIVIVGDRASEGGVGPTVKNCWFGNTGPDGTEASVTGPGAGDGNDTLPRTCVDSKSSAA